MTLTMTPSSSQQQTQKEKIRRRKLRDPYNASRNANIAAMNIGMISFEVS
jgi:hypothetical protein